MSSYLTEFRVMFDYGYGFNRKHKRQIFVSNIILQYFLRSIFRKQITVDGDVIQNNKIGL